MVAGPAIRTLANQKNLEIVVGKSVSVSRKFEVLTILPISASNELAAAEALADDYDNVSAKVLDASSENELRELISKADVVLR